MHNKERKLRSLFLIKNHYLFYKSQQTNVSQQTNITQQTNISQQTNITQQTNISQQNKDITI